MTQNQFNRRIQELLEQIEHLKELSLTRKYKRVWRKTHIVPTYRVKGHYTHVLVVRTPTHATKQAAA
jgi:hypothetical protein